MTKFDKGVGATGAVSGSSNLPLLEKLVLSITVGIIAGIITAVVINLIWKKI